MATLLILLASTSLESEVEAYLQETDMSFRWERGVIADSVDDAFRVQPTGRLQFDLDGRDSDSGLAPALTQNHVGFARVWLGIKGHLNRRVSFWVEADFATGSPALRDVYIGLKNVGPGFVRIGHFRRPFGLDILTSSNDRTFVARAPAAEAFQPGYDAGIGWRGRFGEAKRIWLAVGTFFDTNASARASGEGGWGFAVRFGGLPVEREDSFVWLAVAFDYQNLRMSGQRVRYGARPATSLGIRAVDTGAIEADDAWRIGVEAAARFGSVHAHAEANWARPNAEGDPLLSGVYVQVGWFLTGERRVWAGHRAVWGMNRPTTNFGDGRGAWEIAVRWDATDLDDGAVNGGKIQSITAGLNWYWNPNARVLFNYVYADIEDAPTGSGTMNAVIVRWILRF
ncbi:MAG: porin [Planctomycetota bacterium]